MKRLTLAKIEKMCYIANMLHMAKRKNTSKKKPPTVVFHLVTLFPEMFFSYVGESILARAKREGRIDFKFYNPRDNAKITDIQKTKNKPYKRVDDIPYGGGPGMVMQAVPVAKAIEKALRTIIGKRKKSTEIIWLSPEGKQFTTDVASELAEVSTDIIFICGRYEGIDARIKEMFTVREISVGPYVTTGGELPAMIMIDSISRQLPGVLGNFNSREESRVSSSDTYTRPEVVKWKKKSYAVPHILLSGNHKKIDEWRKNNRCPL
jgi:tRNA (guanine37-N1)-methyltransferase